jgi:hypothetical protein
MFVLKLLLGLFLALMLAGSYPKLLFGLAIGWMFYRLIRRESGGGQRSESWNHGAPARPEPPVFGDAHLAPLEIADLLVLQRGLRELHEAGRLDTPRYEDLESLIESLWAADLDAGSEWRMQRLARAWELLNRHSEQPLGAPPWLEPTAEPLPLQTKAFSPPIAPAQPFTPPVAETAETYEFQSPDGPAATEQRGEPAELLHVPLPAQLSAAASFSSPTALHEAFRPTEPGPLELALKAAGRRWAAFTPFLVQNIGWFIGGFCFVAGSMFLVTYTSGYAKALSVWASLTLYVFLLLWGGFYLRLKRPELRTAALMLLCLSVALIPLALAAAARLWLTAEGTGAWFGAVLASGLGVAGFGLALPLVSGGIDRRLASGQPRIFLALASVQLLAPLLRIQPRWWLLALAHGAILGLTATGVRALLRDWLPAASNERQRLTAYAGGSLVYAAAVSYAHLALSLPVAVPAGYHGPFLMALCALGFHAEARVRAVGREAPWLSRLSFLWYGLSAAALVLAFPGAGPRLLTLVLGAVLYAGVMFRYLTLAPLYALALCVFWLYAELVLLRLPAAVWLWAAAPFWYGLLWANGYALRRRSPALATIARRLLNVLLGAVAAWSLLHAEPGWIGCATALLAAALAETQRRAVPESASREALVAAYAGPFLAMLALIYAPLLPGLDRAGQSALSLGLFQWAGLELTLRRHVVGLPAALAAALLDLAFAALPVTLALAVASTLSWTTAAGLALSALMLGRCGHVLRQRWALYAALLLLSAAVARLKLAYVPGSSGGFALFLTALPVYAALRWQETLPEAAFQLAALRSGRHLPLRLWGRITLELPADAERNSVWSGPLRLAFVALWLAGLVLLGARAATRGPDSLWSVSALAGMAATRLVVARFELPLLMILVHGLGLAAATVLLARWGGGPPAWSLLMAAYGLLLIQPRDLLAWSTGLRRVVPWSPAVAEWNAGLGFLYALAGMTAAVIAAWMQSAPGVLPGFLLGTAAVLVYARHWRGWLEAPAAGLLAGTAVLVYATLNGLGLAALPEERPLPLLFAVLGVSAGWLAESGKRFVGADNPYRRLTRLTAVWWAGAAALTALWQVGPGPAARLDILHFSALMLASVALWRTGQALRRGILAESGLLAGAVALLWLEALVTGSAFAYWAPIIGDRWLALGGIALGLGLIGSFRGNEDSLPWRRMAGFIWLWALASSGGLAVLWIVGRTVEAAHWMPALWILLAVALVPLRPLRRHDPENRSSAQPELEPGKDRDAGIVHGTAIALLLTAGGYSLLAFDPTAVAPLSFAGAFLLLGMTYRFLPVWNARWPRWALAADTWPWLGLVLAGAGLATGGIGLGTVWAASAYPLLWAFLSGWTAPVWVGALGVTLGGLVACTEGVGRFFPGWQGEAGIALAGSAALVWLIFLAEAARRLPSGAEATEAARFRHGLGLALRFWTDMALGAALAAYGLCVVLHLAAWPHGMNPVWLLPAVLLVPALGLRLREAASGRYAGHVLLLAVLFLWLTLDLAASVRVHPGLAGLIWAGAVAYAAGRKLPSPLAEALPFWRAASLGAAVLALALLPASPFDWAVGLAGAGLIAAGIGRQLGDRVWLRAGGLAWLILLHLWPWWVFGGFAPFGWGALQLALWAGIAGSGWAGRWLPADDILADARRESARLARGLAGLEWAVALGLAATGVLPDSLPVLLAGLVLLVLAVLREYADPRADWAGPGLPLMLGSLLLARLMLRGHVAPDGYDGVALIALGYAALGLYERFGLGSLLALARLLPALAWIPVADRPEAASPILAAAGALYLLARRGPWERLWFWLGVLALNLGVYLWVPTLSRSSGLIQIYALPAAVSALVLAHLHRRELRPGTLHSVRLAATATLYAAATMDLFLRPELPVFVLALFLSLLGTGIGIAFRIRAFLYGGTCFLVLAVLGQLFRFYPEDRLARALILMALGTAITAAMIGFQIKREALLRRIRIVRADLGRWA